MKLILFFIIGVISGILAKILDYHGYDMQWVLGIWAGFIMAKLGIWD